MRALRELQKRVFLQTGVTFFTLAIGIDYDPSMQPTSTGVTDVMNNTDDALYSTFSDVYRIMKHFNKVDPRRGWLLYPRVREALDPTLGLAFYRAVDTIYDRQRARNGTLGRRLHWRDASLAGAHLRPLGLP